MTAKESYLEVDGGRTTLTVPHLGGRLTFGYPFKGRQSYTIVGWEIREDKTPSQLYMPNTAEITSLVHAAIKRKNDKNSYADEILRKLSEGLWCYTKNLWTREGVFVVNDRIGDKLDRKNLEKRLKQKDKDVIFVPRGFKTGEQTPKDLIKNPFIIAHAGKEGAKKLAEIASELGYKPQVQDVYINWDYGCETATRISGNYLSGLIFDAHSQESEIRFCFSAGVESFKSPKQPTGVFFYIR